MACEIIVDLSYGLLAGAQELGKGAFPVGRGVRLSLPGLLRRDSCPWTSFLMSCPWLPITPFNMVTAWFMS